MDNSTTSTQSLITGAPTGSQHANNNWVQGDNGWYNLNSMHHIWVDEDYVLGVSFDGNSSDFIIKHFESKEEADNWLNKIMSERNG